MNIYMPKHESKEFLEKLKELRIVDDYKIDKANFGKEKIHIQSRHNNRNGIQYLLPYLPPSSIIIANTENPGNDYLLCIGEVAFSDLPHLQDERFELSILTKNPTTVRFNAWVPFSELYWLFRQPFVRHLTSIHGKIEETSFFVLEVASEEGLASIQSMVAACSTEWIIKENRLYVKLMLKDFSHLYPALQPHCTQMMIIDDEE